VGGQRGLRIWQPQSGCYSGSDRFESLVLNRDNDDAERTSAQYAWLNASSCSRWSFHCSSWSTVSSENSLSEYGCCVDWEGVDEEVAEVYMMGRRLEVGSGSPMKLSDDLEVWIKRLYVDR
jgi:hypothetical protein